MRSKIQRVLLCLFLAVMYLFTSANLVMAGNKKSDSPYKVYLIVGFHINMSHSWRGDTPDEAGFGTDIRVVREVIKMLDDANAKGLSARGYWEGENLFTFEEIIPEHAPDIIEGIRRRVDAGLDEINLAPYSNTLFSALTEDEMRDVIRKAISNEKGSGMKDLFGKYEPILRTQEGTFTTGSIPIIKEEGIEVVTFAYSSYPFSTFSNFIPLMPPEQRYNSTIMRTQDGGDSIILFPCVSIPDAVNKTSMEKWMLELRKLQVSGEVKNDMVIHINFDADSDTWIPMLPDGMSWFPNAGGLPEYIKYVNKYDWVEFTTPGEYLATHEPVGEVIIRQDMADGGWDGNYSWAEKYPSLVIWTDIEQSRLHTYRTQSLLEDAKHLEDDVDGLLYSDEFSSFNRRIRAVSTTHFGMSTPMVNEERQAVGIKIVGEAESKAIESEKIVASYLVKKKSKNIKSDALYSFWVKNTKFGKDASSLVRIPIILDDGNENLSMTDCSGKQIPFSLVNLESLPGKRKSAEIMVFLGPEDGDGKMLHLYKKPGKFSSSGDPVTNLTNDKLALKLDENSGVASITSGGAKIGGPDFLEPFITYKTKKKPVIYKAGDFSLTDLSSEKWDGLKRSALKMKIPFDTSYGKVHADVDVTFTLPQGADWIIADVKVDYPYTVKEDMLHNMIQKLRRYLDLSWIEVAPFQLHPDLNGTKENPLKVWKHNWLNVTSWYELNYADINPINANLDSFNHQVTAGWVSVTDRENGLLISQSAERQTSYAFMPMRLRLEDGKQKLWLNPFGSYHGKQMDYSHMGGNQLGENMAVFAGSQFRPNGPSYNGAKENFSLLIAPYKGDEPPKKLQNDAMAFFYPASVVYIKTPENVDALLKDDIVDMVSEIKLKEERKSQKEMSAPLAFLVNPTERAVDLVWDEPEDARIDGYVVEYKAVDETNWNLVNVEKTNRKRIDDLQNKTKYEFRVKSVGQSRESEWTKTLSAEVGPVKVAGILSMAKSASPKLLLKTFYYAFVHLVTTP